MLSQQQLRRSPSPSPPSDLACCSFQRGVSEDRTEERAFFLPTVAARLSVISKSRPGGKRACESAPGAVYQSRSRSGAELSSSRDLRAETPKKKPERETCRGGNSKRPGARQMWQKHLACMHQPMNDAPVGTDEPRQVSLRTQICRPLPSLFPSFCPSFCLSRGLHE
ncbi:hypothetical protein E1301_Tti003308 [Triplophysa tibetana]|uniref:Uncharacterized protein n=1 Tax=Triplophysa tibetana TaxID=1572043 RepID=A0A5A9PS34_9TELE|nr:hypothetical protein E1301_Tti003308 [Triplophysa tibetana]